MNLQRDDLLPGRNLIGAWCDARDGRRFGVSDPATDAVFATRSRQRRDRCAGRAGRRTCRVPGLARRAGQAARADPQALERPDPRPPGRPRPADLARAGKAACRRARRSRLRGQLRRVVRRGGDARQRRAHPRAAARPPHVRAEGAGRRGGGDHAVELPGGDDRAQDRAGTGRRLHRGVRSPPKTRRSPRSRS